MRLNCNDFRYLDHPLRHWLVLHCFRYERCHICYSIVPERFVIFPCCSERWSAGTLAVVWEEGRRSGYQYGCGLWSRWGREPGHQGWEKTIAQRLGRWKTDYHTPYHDRHEELVSLDRKMHLGVGQWRTQSHPLSRQPRGEVSRYEGNHDFLESTKLYKILLYKKNATYLSSRLRKQTSTSTHGCYLQRKKWNRSCTVGGYREIVWQSSSRRWRRSLVCLLIVWHRTGKVNGLLLRRALCSLIVPLVVVTPVLAPVVRLIGQLSIVLGVRIWTLIVLVALRPLPLDLYSKVVLFV